MNAKEKDIMDMEGDDLLDLLEQIIARDNYGEADAGNIDSDTVLYWQVRLELGLRMQESASHREEYQKG